MINIAFLILWIIIIILLIFLGLQATKNITEINNSKNTFVLNTSDISCFPGGNIENLPSVGNVCCKINGSITSKKSFSIPGYNLPVIVDTEPISFLDACYGFCQNINPLTGVCEDSLLNVNTDYSKCIQAIIPVSQQVNNISINSNIQGCITSSLPVARDQSTPYYVQSPSFIVEGRTTLPICELVPC